MNAGYTINMNAKKWIIVLLTIWIVGILVYSLAILFMYNLFGSFITGAVKMELMESRWMIRRFAEGIQGICASVFWIGSMMLVYRFIKAGCAVSWRKILIAFGGITIGVVACPVLFSIVDSNSTGDYFFPVWSILFYIIVAFVVVTISNFLKKRRYR